MIQTETLALDPPDTSGPCDVASWSSIPVQEVTKGSQALNANQTGWMKAAGVRVCVYLWDHACKSCWSEGWSRGLWEEFWMQGVVGGKVLRLDERECPLGSGRWVWIACMSESENVMDMRVSQMELQAQQQD